MERRQDLVSQRTDTSGWGSVPPLGPFPTHPGCVGRTVRFLLSTEGSSSICTTIGALLMERRQDLVSQRTDTSGGGPTPPLGPFPTHQGCVGGCVRFLLTAEGSSSICTTIGPLLMERRQDLVSQRTDTSGWGSVPPLGPFPTHPGCVGRTVRFLLSTEGSSSICTTIGALLMERRQDLVSQRTDTSGGGPTPPLGPFPTHQGCVGGCVGFLLTAEGSSSICTTIGPLLMERRQDLVSQRTDTSGWGSVPPLGPFPTHPGCVGRTVRFLLSTEGSSSICTTIGALLMERRQDLVSQRTDTSGWGPMPPLVPFATHSGCVGGCIRFLLTAEGTSSICTTIGALLMERRQDLVSQRADTSGWGSVPPLVPFATHQGCVGSTVRLLLTAEGSSSICTTIGALLMERRQDLVSQCADTSGWGSVPPLGPFPTHPGCVGRTVRFLLSAEGSSSICTTIGALLMERRQDLVSRRADTSGWGSTPPLVPFATHQGCVGSTVRFLLSTEGSSSICTTIGPLLMERRQDLVSQRADTSGWGPVPPLVPFATHQGCVGGFIRFPLTAEGSSSICTTIGPLLKKRRQDLVSQRADTSGWGPTPPLGPLATHQRCDRAPSLRCRRDWICNERYVPI